MNELTNIWEKRIRPADVLLLEHNSNSYAYVPGRNALYEIDSNLEMILRSDNEIVSVIYDNLPLPLEKGEFLDVIHSLIENEMINQERKTKEIETAHFRSISALTLMMVQECNLKCTYCYAGDGEYNEKGKMNFETAKRSVDFLIQNSGDIEELTLVFFGGEPLLNFETIEQVVYYANKLAETHHKKIKYSMTCNGTLITPKIIEFIRAHDMYVQISVDGQKAAHDQNRFYGNKKGSYEIIMNRTEELRNKNQLGVRSTLTPDNTNYTEIYQHLFSLNFRSAFLAPAMQMFNSESFEELGVEYEILTQYFLELIEEREYGKAKKINNIMKYLQRLHSGFESTYSCGAEVNFFAVDIHGDLYPCHRFVNNKNYKQGNIYSEIDHYKKKDFLLEAHTSNRKNCNYCWARNLCGGGCHHENYELTGAVTSPPVDYCKLTKTQLNSIFHLYLTLTEEEKEILLG
ncbi:SPASM domain-containing protein [Paenibacillus sp. JJ-223]|uniref:PapB family radical SAM/SPASM ranthipeptide maturase n=1 Tax=Paenibacillus sp. JJ-223 TaxID=2905647 RepID=UPI001F2C9B6E|nr:SPASM domain-containing protein [Paenibacillus sp. JJ-223]CAH1191141.1 GTP 3',8-cyclase [Paenibacillus sp. JJ-223]